MSAMSLDKKVAEEINRVLEKWQPWQIVVASSITTVLGVALVDLLIQDESLYLRGKKFALRNLRKFPAVKKKIAEEISKSQIQMEDDLFRATNNLQPIRVLPSSKSAEEVIRLASQYKETEHVNWNRLSGTVYSGADDLTKLVTKVYELYAWSNPLHPDVFPSVRQMEAEVIRICCSLFNGDPQTCGSMTSGGTESILMAVKTHRDRAIARGIKKPILVAPVTAHAAFDKAANYLGLHIKHIAVDPVTFQVDLKAMEKAISSRVCMLVGSAPQYPHGIIDPIEKIAALGEKYNIPVHVDCCLGGFLLPFMEQAGFPLPLFDFRLKGVCSISADTHKYGYAPKGSSVVMYRDHSYLHHQYYVTPDWPGGIYASPSMSGSRVGASIATTWAVMLYLGKDGYVDATRDIIRTARQIERGLRQIAGLFVLGAPQVSVVSFGSNIFNIYRLSDAMSARGWNLNALQYPSSVHICVTRQHTKDGVVERFLEDIQGCVEEILKNPGEKDSGMAAIYGMAQSVPDRSVVSEIAWTYLDTCVALPRK